MRALVISAWPPWPLDDGARLILHHQLEHLAEEHDITLLAAGRSGDDPERERPPAGVDIRCIAPASGRLPAYVGARRRAIRGWEPITVGHVITPGLKRGLTELLQPPADVVHLFGWGTAPLAGMVRPAPVVYSAIDAWSLGHGSRPRPFPARLLEVDQAHLIRRHERRHYPRCDAVVVVSEHDAAHLRRLAPKARIEVVPNGVDPGPEPRAIDDGQTIGFHGVLSTRPNAEAARHLVRTVLPGVRRRVRGARALVVGRNPPDDVRSEDGRVEVSGGVDDVRPWLERISVYVAPMTSGTGLKNKVLEAMAAGRPVVATHAALGGIGSGEGVIGVDSVDALAQPVADLLSEPARRLAMGREARSRVVREFTWERSASRVEALWRDVSGRP